MNEIRFVLNGALVAVAGVAPTLTLLEWLRGRGLTGTKEGCAEGDCGACTVAIRTPALRGLRTRAVNACIMPLPMAHGTEVVTVEGIGGGPGGRTDRRAPGPAAATHRSAEPTPHPIQREMADRHASQCGFCTPGIVMALWCRDPGAPADSRAISDRLAGNLCRCTGYGPILDAALHAAAETDVLAAAASDDKALAATLAAIPPLDYGHAGQRFLAPVTETGFAAAVAQNPGATIIAGATDVGLWITKRLFDPPAIISSLRVAEFSRIAEEDGALVVGAAVTLAQFMATVATHSPSLAEMLRRFGGVQVRDAGTVGGNIANGSPIGDLPPALIAAGATLELGFNGGSRTLPLEDYFVAYGRQDRRLGEYVRAVRVPLGGLAALSCHKVTKRFDSDISAVCGTFMLRLADGIVSEARLAFGGMAATPKRAVAAETALRGRVYDAAAVNAAAEALAQDFAPISDQRASAAYRLAVAKNLLRRDHIERTAAGTLTRLAGTAAARIAA